MIFRVRILVYWEIKALSLSVKLVLRYLPMLGNNNEKEVINILKICWAWCQWDEIVKTRVKSLDNFKIDKSNLNIFLNCYES
jgi:hypothetical protein